MLLYHPCGWRVKIGRASYYRSGYKIQILYTNKLNSETLFHKRGHPFNERTSECSCPVGFIGGGKQIQFQPDRNKDMYLHLITYNS